MIKRMIRELQFRSPLRRYFFPQYAYMFTPPQLCFLCECLESTRNVVGGIAEIGCSNGGTTVFLSKYLQAQGIEKRYRALDTFRGFEAADIDVEVGRGKSAGAYTGFRVNDQRWFDATMRRNGVVVESIKADVNLFDLESLAPLSFVLLDVDLYRPIAKALPELYRALSPGGMIVVDDCDEQVSVFDGAAHAYKNFMQGKGLPVEIAHRKLGIVRKGHHEL